MSALKVLFASSEVNPFAKTGGLADVSGSLPKALLNLGVDIRVVMPKYKNIPLEYTLRMKSEGTGKVNMLFRDIGFEIFSLKYQNITYYFIEHYEYFNREGFYGYFDDGERFTYFAKVIFEMLPILKFKPDIIHSNDWQTAAINILAKTFYKFQDYYKDIKTVFSIHNMKYQGVFPKEIMDSLLGISWENFTYDKLEFHDQVNFLKGAITLSDIVNTVSKTYAEEIKNDYFSENLGGVTRSRMIYGIINGIDYDEFNPLKDKRIFVNYDHTNLTGKYENKKLLQKELKLPVKSRPPMIGVITRLVENKGIDLINTIMDELLTKDVQIVILGTGESHYEDSLKYFQNKYPEKFSGNTIFDVNLSHKIYASSDLFLVPSKFEPCGLSQLISLKYGSVPVVRETGGLKDTIIPWDSKTNSGTGFSFSNYNAHDMLYVINQAIDLYYDREVWRNLIISNMQLDFSWNNSGKEYLNMYQTLYPKR